MIQRRNGTPKETNASWDSTSHSLIFSPVFLVGTLTQVSRRGIPDWFPIRPISDEEIQKAEDRLVNNKIEALLMQRRQKEAELQKRQEEKQK